MKKRHHTVPKCYLENFTDHEGFVWVLDTKNSIFRIKPENILLENHFYTITLKNGEKSLVVEDTLANIEGAYIGIFQNKISKDCFLTMEERAKVAVFIAALYIRTSPYRENMRSALGRLKDGIEDWKKQFEDLEVSATTLTENCLTFGLAKPRFDGLETLVGDLKNTNKSWDMLKAYYDELHVISGQDWLTFSVNVYVLQDFATKWSDALKAAYTKGSYDSVADHISSTVEKIKKVYHH